MRDTTRIEQPRQRAGRTSRKRDGKQAPVASSKALSKKLSLRRGRVVNSVQAGRNALLSSTSKLARTSFAWR